MSGQAKIQTRNATVFAKAEGDEGVDAMMMTGADLEKLLQEGDDQIDVRALMKTCLEEHVQREAMRTTRQVWQRSGATTCKRHATTCNATTDLVSHAGIEYTDV